MPYATDTFGLLSINYYAENPSQPFTAKETSDQNEPHFTVAYPKGQRLYFRISGTAGAQDFTKEFFDEIPYGQTPEQAEAGGYSYKTYDATRNIGYMWISPTERNEFYFAGYVSSTDEANEPTERYKVEFFQDPALTSKIGETREYTILGASSFRISSPPTAFGTSVADNIISFNPAIDKLQIALDAFEGAIDELRFAKNPKQLAKLAKRDIDFIYNQPQGFLYYNENGRDPGYGNGGIFAIFDGSPKLSFDNFEFL